eukprot:3126888-Amphidinium_carterae.1
MQTTSQGDVHPPPEGDQWRKCLPLNHRPPDGRRKVISLTESVEIRQGNRLTPSNAFGTIQQCV